MRSEVHMRDGTAVLLLVLMFALGFVPVRRDDQRTPASVIKTKAVARSIAR